MPLFEQEMSTLKPIGGNFPFTQMKKPSAVLELPFKILWKNKLFCKKFVQTDIQTKGSNALLNLLNSLQPPNHKLAVKMVWILSCSKF